MRLVLDANRLFAALIKDSMEIMKNIDPDDAVFLAVSFCSPNDGIWTEDAHFGKQDAVKIWKTTELMEVLGM
jgi:predicted nucleic acid-binding protein